MLVRGLDRHLGLREAATRLQAEHRALDLHLHRMSMTTGSAQKGSLLCAGAGAGARPGQAPGPARGRDAAAGGARRARGARIPAAPARPARAAHRTAALRAGHRGGARPRLHPNPVSVPVPQGRSLLRAFLCWSLTCSRTLFYLDLHGSPDSERETEGIIQSFGHVAAHHAGAAGGGARRGPYPISQI